MNLKKLNNRFNLIKNEANVWLRSWNDIRDYFAPERGYFNNKVNYGELIDHNKILNETGMQAVGVLAAGLISGLTSPSRPWFKLGLSNKELLDLTNVKIWLDQAQEKMMLVFDKSNIYGALSNIYKELSVFGVAAAVILEDEDDIIRAYNFTSGEYYLITSNKGKVIGLGREYQKTVEQLVNAFGIDNVSSEVASLYKTDILDKWVTVRNLIIEKTHLDIDYSKEIKNGAKFISIYWELSSTDNKILKKSTFDDNPIIAPRWELVTNSSIYSKSPGFFALGANKQLQKMESDKLVALAKVINPPMQKDSSVQGVISLMPGGITNYSATTPNSGLKPAYQINPDLQSIEFSIDKIEKRIKEIFFNDLFLMLISSNTGKMTAREVVERHDEKIGRLSPVLESFRQELLDPLITRTFNIMLKNGLFDELPEELLGKEINIEYISILAQSQKMIGTSNIDQNLMFLGSVAQMKPDVLDNINFDELVLDYQDKLGISAKIIRSKDEVAQIRQSRQDEQDQIQQSQNMMNLTQGAKTLSDTPLNTNSALDSVIKQISGGQPNAA